MFPLAHLGIGSGLSRLVRKELPFGALLLGTMLPDLLDKPVFFILGSIKYFQDLGWEPGKRGFAHTLLFLILLAAISWWRKSARWSAVTLGVATHLLLDVISKSFGGDFSPLGGLKVLLWPVLGWDFPLLSYGMHGTVMWTFEAIGFALLIVQLAVERFRPNSIFQKSFQ